MNRPALLKLLAFSLLLASLASSVRARTGDGVVAVVNDEPITFSEFRESVAESLGIPVVLIPRNAKHRFETWLNQQRDVLGPPWQQDHKDAAARALIALG